MGLSFIQGTVRGPTGISAEVGFLIDSGAMYSLLPHALWNGIGLAPKRTMDFALADGTTFKAQGSRFKAQGSMFKAQGSMFKAQCSRIG
jgi:predicted aspartyl protease